VSAAAGVAALTLVKDTPVTDQASAAAAKIRDGLNEVITERGLRWAAYGSFSGFHLFLNPEQRDLNPANFDPTSLPFSELKANPPGFVDKLRIAMMVNGVDITGWPGGTVSSVHRDDDIDRTVEAFERSIDALQREGELSPWLA
ncbi:MAG: aspartate aminotransferase family protein, partial [Pseudomonadota bacterium]